jgi:hypothetical protein
MITDFYSVAIAGHGSTADAACSDGWGAFISLQRLGCPIFMGSASDTFNAAYGSAIWLETRRPATATR